ncbi:MAG: NAD-dependent epimerase/dehydratase family protein [Archangium sp.]
MKVIVTGVTGMVGEGVLLSCLDDAAVTEVLAVSRKPSGHTHAKLKELLVPDFTKLEGLEGELEGYDACFYCAGVSSVGMSEADYTKITYDTVVAFAQKLVQLNPTMVMCHVSGASTDGTEKGSTMWARVKGRAENALMKMGFKGTYNFRPGLMLPVPGQKNLKTGYKIALVFAPVMKLLFPALKLQEVQKAMMNAATKGAPKQVLEVADIKALAAQS